MYVIGFLILCVCTQCAWVTNKSDTCISTILFCNIQIAIFHCGDNLNTEMVWLSKYSYICAHVPILACVLLIHIHSLFMVSLTREVITIKCVLHHPFGKYRCASCTILMDAANLGLITPDYTTYYILITVLSLTAFAYTLLLGIYFTISFIRLVISVIIKPICKSNCCMQLFLFFITATRLPSLRNSTIIIT